MQFIVTGINAQNNDSIYDGLTKFYYSNGEVSSEGMMVDGLPNLMTGVYIVIELMFSLLFLLWPPIE